MIILMVVAFLIVGAVATTYEIKKTKAMLADMENKLNKKDGQ